MSRVEITYEMRMRAEKAYKRAAEQFCTSQQFGGYVAPMVAALDAALNPPEIPVTNEMYVAWERFIPETPSPTIAAVYRAMRKLEPK